MRTDAYKEVRAKDVKIGMIVENLGDPLVVIDVVFNDFDEVEIWLDDDSCLPCERNELVLIVK